MAFTILVTAPTLARRGLERLERAGCQTLFVTGGDEQLADLMATQPIDAVIARTMKLSASMIESCPTLRVISKHGVGYNNVDVVAATKRRIPVFITPGANSQSVAELATGLMLAAARGIVKRDGLIRAGGWPRSGDGVQLSGRKLGVVGLGQIGSRVAAMGAALGMRVLGYDPKARLSNVETCASLNDLLRQADVVTLHCPLTTATAGFIGEEQFALMKDGAILVNTARGELVEEAAFVRALSTGKLHSAAVDSFAVEPLPATSPLLGLDNLILSPHVGASTDDALQAMGDQAAHNAIAILRNEPFDPLMCVNPDALALALKVS